MKRGWGGEGEEEEEEEEVGKEERLDERRGGDETRRRKGMRRRDEPSTNQLLLIFHPQKVGYKIKMVRVRVHRFSFSWVPQLFTSSHHIAIMRILLKLVR